MGPGDCVHGGQYNQYLPWVRLVHRALHEGEMSTGWEVLLIKSLMAVCAKKKGKQC